MYSCKNFLKKLILKIVSRRQKLEKLPSKQLLLLPIGGPSLTPSMHQTPLSLSKSSKVSYNVFCCYILEGKKARSVDPDKTAPSENHLLYKQTCATAASADEIFNFLWGWLKELLCVQMTKCMK